MHYIVHLTLEPQIGTAVTAQVLSSSCYLPMDTAEQRGRAAAWAGTICLSYVPLRHLRAHCWERTTQGHVGPPHAPYESPPGTVPFGCQSTPSIKYLLQTSPHTLGKSSHEMKCSPQVSTCTGRSSKKRPTTIVCTAIHSDDNLVLQCRCAEAEARANRGHTVLQGFEVTL